MRLISITLVLVLTACATPTAKQDFNLAENPQSGLLVGSVTASRSPSAYTATVRYYIDWPTRGRSRMHAIEITDKPIIFEDQIDLDGNNGRLFAIELQPGDYSIVRWQMNNGSHADISPKKFQALPFRIEAGKATYIGNVHMDVWSGKNFLGITINTGGEVKILDKGERDIPLLLERYPNLKREDIVASILESPAPSSGDNTGMDVDVKTPYVPPSSN